MPGGWQIKTLVCAFEGLSRLAKGKGIIDLG